MTPVDAVDKNTRRTATSRKAAVRMGIRPEGLTAAHPPRCWPSGHGARRGRLRHVAGSRPRAALRAPREGQKGLTRSDPSSRFSLPYNPRRAPLSPAHSPGRDRSRAPRAEHRAHAGRRRPARQPPASPCEDPQEPAHRPAADRGGRHRHLLRQARRGRDLRAAAGIDDIRLPYPVHPSNADRVVALLDQCRLSIIVDHAAIAAAWSEAMTRAGLRARRARQGGRGLPPLRHRSGGGLGRRLRRAGGRVCRVCGCAAC